MAALETGTLSLVQFLLLCLGKLIARLWRGLEFGGSGCCCLVVAARFGCVVGNCVGVSVVLIVNVWLGCWLVVV